MISWLRNRAGQSLNTPFTRSRMFSELPIKLQGAFFDIMAIAWFTNGSDGQGIKLLGYTFHDLLIYMGYQLIDFCPLGKRENLSQEENVVHLGLLSFMATFFLPLGQKRFTCAILIDVARSASQQPFDEKKESQQLLVWFLLIGVAAMYQPEDDTWLIPILMKAASNLGLRTWGDVCGVLSKFPWIKCKHNKLGLSLWNRLKFQEKITTRIPERLIAPNNSTPTTEPSDRGLLFQCST
jgi:hypothetical protein